MPSSVAQCSGAVGTFRLAGQAKFLQQGPLGLERLLPLGPNAVAVASDRRVHRLAGTPPAVVRCAPATGMRPTIADFPRVTPNDLRHTAASLAVSAGSNVLALARMLGHEDPSLTLKTYADLFGSDLDALADVLDQHRTAALRPSIVNGNSESEADNAAGNCVQAVGPATS
jgi:integrase